VSFQQKTDSQLVSMTRERDYGAFEVLVTRYQDRVFGLALGMLRDEVDAQDVVQETFLSVFRNISSFREESAFSSWLYRIAANNAMMKLRKRRSAVQLSLDEVLPQLDSTGLRLEPTEEWPAHRERSVEDKELGGQIRDAVARLPEKYRLVFLLSDVKELSMKEVATILELSVSNVKTRLHRARLFLREELSHYLSG